MVTIHGRHRLYEVEYEDGNKMEFYHNEIHAHKDKVKITLTKALKSSKPKRSNFGKARKGNSKAQ